MGGGGGGKKGGGAQNDLNKVLQGQLQLQQAQFARETPFYNLAQQRTEFGQSFFPEVATAIRNPTANPYYDLALREGINRIRNDFSVTGSPSSGPGQIAAGRFAAGLQADQVNRMIDRLLGVAGFQGAPPGTAASSYSGPIGSTASQLAQLRNEPSFAGQLGAFAGGQLINQGISAGLGGLGGLMGGIFGGAGPITDIVGVGGPLIVPGILTSSEEYKEDIKPVSEAERMLDHLRKTPIYTWKYKKEFNDDREHIGTTTQKAPPSIVNPDGKSLDPINYFGLLTLGFQDLDKKVRKLEKVHG